MEGSTLIIRPLKVNITQEALIGGYAFPRVFIEIGKERYETASLSLTGTTSGTYKEEFTHHLGLEMDFRFIVRDYAPGIHESIGSGIVKLAKTFDYETTSQWYDMKTLNGKYAGQVEFNLELRS